MLLIVFACLNGLWFGSLGIHSYTYIYSGILMFKIETLSNQISDSYLHCNAFKAKRQPTDQDSLSANEFLERKR